MYIRGVPIFPHAHRRKQDSYLKVPQVICCSLSPCQQLFCCTIHYIDAYFSIY